MKKNSLIFILLCFAMSTMFTTSIMAAAAPKTRTIDPSNFDFRIGLGINLNTTKINLETTDGDMENTLNNSYIALCLEADVMDQLTVGVIAGMNSNRFQDPFQVTELPLSLELGDKSSSSMVFGINARSEFFNKGDFSVTATGEFTLYKLHENQHTITLPIVTGTAVSKNAFNRITAQLLITYDGFTNFSLFAGPRLNLLNGSFKVGESLQSLGGETSMDYKQKQALGLTAGARFDVGENFVVNLQAAALADTSFTINVFYEF